MAAHVSVISILPSIPDQWPLHMALYKVEFQEDLEMQKFGLKLMLKHSILPQDGPKNCLHVKIFTANITH